MGSSMKFMMFKFCVIIAFVLNLQVATCDDVDCDTFYQLSGDEVNELPQSDFRDLNAVCGCDELNQLGDEQLESLIPSGLEFFAIYLTADSIEDIKKAAEGFLGQIQAEKNASNANSYTGSKPQRDLLLGICKIAKMNPQKFNPQDLDPEKVHCDKILRLKDEEAKKLWVQFGENPKYFLEYFLRNIHNYTESNLLTDPCSQEKISQHSLKDLCDFLKPKALKDN